MKHAAGLRVRRRHKYDASNVAEAEQLDGR